MARKLIKTSPRMGYKGMAKMVAEANRKFKQAIHSETTPDELRKTFIRAEDTPNQKIEIYSVNGTYIRDNLYQDWTSGGHHYVSENYHFIPDGQIWIDDNLNEKDREATIVHELKEYDLMKFEGLGYEKAHDMANEAEKEFREQDSSKESYYMTKDEFINKTIKEIEIRKNTGTEYNKQQNINRLLQLKNSKGLSYDIAIALHKQSIQEALSEGKSVPENVLKDYPELKKDTTMFTITKKKHDKTGKDIWVAKLNEKIDYSVFKSIQSQVKAIGGYYSKFVKGFVFNEDPEEKLKSIKGDMTPAAPGSKPEKKEKSGFMKKLDLEKLSKAKKKPRKDVIIDEIKAGKMEFAVHKSFNGMVDAYDYYTVTNESFTPAEGDDRLIQQLERAKGQSHWVYSATIGHSESLGYYIDFSDYYIRYKQDAAKSLTQSRSALIPKKEPEAPEQITGGLADNLNIEDIAEKHGKDLGWMKEQWNKGTLVEAEHTSDINKAGEIALDHLFESADYYIELEKMEQKLEEKDGKIDLTYRVRKIDRSKYQVYNDEVVVTHTVSGDVFNYFTNEGEANRAAAKLNNVNQSRSEFMDELHPLDMWLLFTDNRYYRKFEFKKDLSQEKFDEYFREIVDRGVKERITENEKDGITSVIISVKTESEADEISDLYMKLFPNDANSHRVFTVHKDGSPNVEFDNLTESEAEKIYHEQSKLANSEIVTWDKAEYNKYGKLSGRPTIRIYSAIKKDDENETINEDELAAKAFKDKISNEPVSQEIRFHPDIKGRSNTYGYSFKVESITFDKNKNEGKVFIFGEYDRYGAHRKNIFYLTFYLLDGKIIFSGINYQDRIGILTAESKNILVEELESEHLSKGFVEKIWGFIESDILPLESKPTKELMYKKGDKVITTEQYLVTPIDSEGEVIESWFDGKDEMVKILFGQNQSGQKIINNIPAWALSKITSIIEPKPEKPSEPIVPISEKPSDEGYDLVKKIRMIIDTNGTEREAYSPDELRLLRQYTGMGGYATRTDKGAVDTGLLDQFYTPYPVIEKMFGLAFKHGFSFEGSKRILEPATGIGRFLEYIPKDQSVTAYEIDKYAYTIAKISFPEFEIFNEPFETMFFKGNRRIGLRNVEEKYDLVIGNPPYREFVSKYAIIEDASSQSEKSDTLALTFDQYMLMRGIDVLNPGGLLVFIIPSSFMANDKKYNNFKNLLSKKAELVDAYRLPQSTFPNTQITTDILVLKRK